MPVTEITSQSQFAAAITAKNKLVCIDYFATWCGPCKAIAPQFDALANKYDKQCSFYRVDVDKCQDVARQQQITAMPTFMFYGNGQPVGKVQGANAAEIENNIVKLHPQYTKNVFAAGQGYSLNRPTSAASSTTNTTQQQPSAQPRRNNPWADPSFANKMLQKAEQKPAVQQPTTNTNNTTTATTANVEAKTDTPSSTAAQPTTTQQSANNVDQSLLQQLTDMGFNSVRASKGLHHTGNKSVEAAMNWCLEHENDKDIDTPLQVDNSNAASSAESAPKPAGSSLKKDELPADWDDMDEDDRLLYEEYRKKHGDKPFVPTMNAEQREQVEKQKFSEMTKEQQDKWLAAKRLEAKTKREKEERQRAIDSEKNRQSIHASAQELKEKREKYEMEMMIQKKKREEAEKVRVRNELRMKLQADKERRAKELQQAMEDAKKQKEAAAAQKK